MAVLPTPGSPMSTGLFLVRRQRIWTTRSSSWSRPTSGSSLLSMAAWVRSRLNSASSETLLGPAARRSSRTAAGQFFANGGEPQPALVQDFGGEALFFAQQAQQQVLGADVLVIQPLGFFGRVGQHALALVAERQIDRGGHLLADGRVALDLLADGFHRRVRAEEAVGQAPCPRAAGPAAGARFRCRDCRTGWPRSGRRRSLSSPSPCIFQT